MGDSFNSILTNYFGDNLLTYIKSKKLHNNIEKNVRNEDDDQISYFVDIYQEKYEKESDKDIKKRIIKNCITNISYILLYNKIKGFKYNYPIKNKEVNNNELYKSLKKKYSKNIFFKLWDYVDPNIRINPDGDEFEKLLSKYGKSNSKRNKRNLNGLISGNISTISKELFDYT